MSERRRVGCRARVVASATLLIVLGLPSTGVAQDLADFDYENLSFRGIGVEWAQLHPTRVDVTESWGLRFDLGFLGPGLRIVPSVSRWSSRFKATEVDEFEARLAGLIVSQTGGPPPTVDLADIEWTDIAISVDAHVVWALPLDLISFMGVGASTHLMNGSGAAIDDTFIEDLLDSATAGFNLHIGVEYPLVDRFRIFGQGRYEVLGDLQYFHIGTGVQLMFGSLMPGEGRGS